MANIRLPGLGTNDAALDASRQRTINEDEARRLSQLHQQKFVNERSLSDGQPAASGMANNITLRALNSISSSTDPSNQVLNRVSGSNTGEE